MKQLLSSLVARYQAWSIARQELAELRAMDDRALADIALTRADLVRIERGEYIDPRPAILAGRAEAHARQEAEQQSLFRLAA